MCYEHNFGNYKLYLKLILFSRMISHCVIIDQSLISICEMTKMFGDDGKQNLVGFYIDSNVN
jgi:hypothetical protein